MKTLFYSYKSFEACYLQAGNTQGLETGYTSESLSLKTVAGSKGYEAISVFTGDDVSGPAMDELKNNGIRFIHPL